MLLRPSELAGLPEETVDHVDHFAAPGVDQQRVVIIADPARPGIGWRKAVHPRVVEPIAAPIIARPQPPADRVGPVTPAERVVVKAEVEQRPVAVTVIVPVVAVVVAPIAVPMARTRRTARGCGRRRLGSFARDIADDRRRAAFNSPLDPLVAANVARGLGGVAALLDVGGPFRLARPALDLALLDRFAAFLAGSRCACRHCARLTCAARPFARCAAIAPSRRSWRASARSARSASAFSRRASRSRVAVLRNGGRGKGCTGARGKPVYA